MSDLLGTIAGAVFAGIVEGSVLMVLTRLPYLKFSSDKSKSFWDLPWFLSCFAGFLCLSFIGAIRLAADKNGNSQRNTNYIERSHNEILRLIDLEASSAFFESSEQDRLEILDRQEKLFN